MFNRDNNDRGGFKKPMFQGDWACSKCGEKITELPFEPDPARLDRLLCRNCHMERVKSFRR